MNKDFSNFSARELSGPLGSPAETNMSAESPFTLRLQSYISVLTLVSSLGHHALLVICMASFSLNQHHWVKTKTPTVSLQLKATDATTKTRVP